MKIAHIADTHIKQIKDHNEYREIFSDLFCKLKQESPDIIVHCGDIAHNKTNLSPEFIDICAFFLKGLESIAPTLIILGNHDGNLNNLSRQDAISPIISLLPVDKRPSLFRTSCEFEIENFKFHVISRFDKNHALSLEDDKINIVLYHGSISGCKTDSGFILQKGDENLSFFDGFDFGMFGDIHKHQFLDKAGRFAYPGSTCIQNFGEFGEKGFLLWDIKSKDDFECKFISVFNPNPYISISSKDIDKIPEKCRARIIFDEQDEESKEEILAKIPESVSIEAKVFLSSKIKDVKSVNEKKENFDFFQYISRFEKNEENQQKIIDEIKKIRSELKIEDSSFLSSWKIKKLSWDNFFNYGEKNHIDFEKINGNILGIFGKNYSGKSSIIDVLIFSIFGECTKNIKKLSQIVNLKKQSAFCEIEIEGDGKKYCIVRTIDSGKGTLSLSCDGKSINGSDKNETEKTIKKLFGTADHFLLSSIVSQFDCFQFLNATSSKRKEYLLSFLDLDEIEKIGENASSKMRDLKAEKKIWDGKGLHAEKERIASVLDAELLDRESLHRNGFALYEANLKQMEAMQKQVSASNFLKPYACSSKQSFLEMAGRFNEIASSSPSKIEELRKSVEKKRKFIKKIDEFDAKTIVEQNAVALERAEKLQSLKSANVSLEWDIGMLTGSVSVLSSIPCDKSLATICPLTKNAFENKEKIEKKKMELGKNLQELKDLLSFLKIDEEAISAMKEYENILKKRDESKKELLDKEKTIESLELGLSEAKKVIDLIKEYGEETFYSNVNQFQLATLKSDIFSYEKEDIALDLARKNLEEKKKLIDDDIQKMKECEEQCKKYLVLSEMFHKDGLISIIIEDFIPYINKKMDEILQNFVDFSIRLENCKDKLEIYLKSSLGERTIEMCSGSEKTFAAMALRIALTKLGNIPSSNVFILDEPATSLDGDHILQFQKFLNMAKEEFDCSILITHLEQMKDAVDKILMVQLDKNGFAYLEE